MHQDQVMLKGTDTTPKNNYIDQVMNQNLRGQSTGGDGSQQLGVDQ